METVTLGLLMLAAVLISAVIDQLVPKISLPLIQIALGLVIAVLAPASISIELEPDFFLVFFIAPLLYNEAKNADKALLWRDKKPILALAIGLAVATAVVIGFAVHAAIPAISLAAAIALGGALGPTDAVAVSSLSRQVDIPERQSSILKGELLLNDASGIVVFQFALSAAITGTFSIVEATGDFLVEFFGGLLFGAVLGFLGNYIVRKVRSIGVENTTFHVLFELCVPFLVYLISDTCHVSGIIAVVVAGLVNVISPRAIGPSISRMNIVSSSVWRVLTFALNGVVFVLLGTQLPNAMQNTWEDVTFGNGMLLLCVLGITAILLGTRFLWVLAMDTVHARRREHRPFTRKDVRGTLITTLSGAKGTITLSILFTIPVFASSGERFQNRDLIIFLACGVIVCTLLLATFVVPLVAPKQAKKPSEIDAKQREVECSIEILRNVIEELNARRTHENRRETQAVIRAYNDRLSRIKDVNDIEDEPNIELRKQALRWEEERTLQLLAQDKVSGVVGYQYLSRLNRAENLIEHHDGRVSVRRSWRRLRASARRMLHALTRNVRKKPSSERMSQTDELRALQAETSMYVVERLEQAVASTEIPTEDAASLLLEYQSVATAMHTSTMPTVTTAIRVTDRIDDVRRFAYQFELEQIQTMYEDERLSRAAAKRMRENVYLMQLDLGDNV